MAEIRKITEKQYGFLKGLCEQLSIDMPASAKTLSSKEAGQEIERLLELQKDQVNQPDTRKQGVPVTTGIAPGQVNPIRLGLAAKIVANNWIARNRLLPIDSAANKENYAVEVLGMYEALAICEAAAEKKHKEASKEASSSSSSVPDDQDYKAEMAEERAREDVADERQWIHDSRD